MKKIDIIKKFQKMLLQFMISFLCILGGVIVSGSGQCRAEEMMQISSNMKTSSNVQISSNMKTLSSAQVSSKEQMSLGTLYAGSAVLMDGSSGRVLYEKNGEEFMANASTTKILTCILALENAEFSEVVSVSAYAASMPDVQLHIKEGEQYYMGDLLYSLMLESHNDVAVAIAEHISGSQEEFSKLMNQKAMEIGCKNTMFLTPNGLDAKVSQKEIFHGTTATDLALIMRYCIKISPKKEEFVKITQTATHTFQNVEGTRSFFCRNHNSFLNMMEGVISGKTGFTSKAGYCYVGALEQEGECYIVALLACGWPNNKNYKWADCKKLINYGLETYHLFALNQLEKDFSGQLAATVKNAKREEIEQEALILPKKEKGEISEVLLKEDEAITVRVEKKELMAPLEKGQEIGKIIYYIEGEKWLEENLYCEKNVEKIDFIWCIRQILGKTAIRIRKEK